MFSCQYDEVVVGGALDQGMPPLGSAQFERAIAVNALAPLDGTLRALLLETHRLVNDTNRLIEKQTHLTPQDPRGAALYRSTDKVLREIANACARKLPNAHEALWAAIGRPQTRALHTR